MVPFVVEQAVDRKIRMQSSVLVGNYEFYYAAGLLSAETDLAADGSSAPAALEQAVKAACSAWNPSDPEGQYLKYLAGRYEAEEREYDDDMKALFEAGRNRRRDG